MRLISVVVPLKDERENVRPLVERVRDALRECGPWELVLVDDGSTDDTFRELEAAAKLLQPNESISQLAKQNIQARLRAERMWTWSNCASGLFLQTSNMSEKSVGYATIGGDRSIRGSP